MKAERNRTLEIEAWEEPILREQISTSYSEGTLPINTLFQSYMEEVLPKLPDHYFDLVFLDPPYNLNKDFGTVKFKSKGITGYLDYIESWIDEVIRVLKPSGSLYFCGDWRSSTAIQLALEPRLSINNRITFQREKGRGAQRNWKNAHEDIWFATANSEYYFDVESVKIKRKVIAPYKIDGKPKDWIQEQEGDFRLTFPSNFWDDISIPFWSMPENTPHPTQKPEKLLARIILASCPVGGLVLDPFLGSGTTAVVAKKLGRKYVGIEANPEYCLFAAKRLKMAEEDRSIQGYSQGIFWERNSEPANLKRNKTTTHPTLF